MRAGTERLPTAEQGLELGRDPHVAAAAVGAAHKMNDGRTATRAAESIVCGEEAPGDGFPKRRAAALERVRGRIRQRPFSRELIIDIGKIRQRTHGRFHRHP